MNPLLSLTGRQNQNNVLNIMNAVRMAGNPAQALQTLANQNPDLAQILNLCQGKDPRSVFYSECERRGINPDDILSQMK